MSNFITEENLAKIAIKKNLVKEYKNSNANRVVYLNNGTEFQIYLKNPYQYHVGIKIYVNDKSIGNMLVLRPGQSWWLDRFMNSNSKFLFSTYEVEDTPEMNYATNKNGKVRIEFYPEDERLTNNDWCKIGDYTVHNGDMYNNFNVTCSDNSTYGSPNSVFSAIFFLKISPVEIAGISYLFDKISATLPFPEAGAPNIIIIISKPPYYFLLFSICSS